MSSKWVDANGNQWRFSSATNTWQALVNGRWVARPLPAGGLKRGDLDRYRAIIVETMGPPGASGAPGPMMSVQPLATKSAPDDDDQFILADSDDFWNLRKISSTDLKSAMLNHVSTTAVNLSNKTLINPRVSDTIRDGAGGSVLKIEGASGSVNHLTVRSSATGNAVGLTATGSDAAINIAIDPKGAGQVLLGGVPAVTTTGNQTLTNKTINLTSNTLTGTVSQFNTALSDGDFATVAGAETLTNKTISLTNNTLAGTIGQFNTALAGADFATIAGTETLTNKTLTSPTITGASITGSSVTGASALSMGNTTTTGTATPLFLSLGGTYGTSTAGSAANLKLKVHEDSLAAFGLGISASNLEYQVPLSNYAHRFYAGGTEVAAITSTGITASGVAVPTISSISTLTNKTLSGADNTFSAVPQSAVTNLASDLAARELAANKGQPSGYASLDSGGKVPVTQLPHSIMQYQGTWNVSTNTPALADGSGDTGDVYRVTVGGSRNLGSGSITFDVGDYAIYNGTVWEKSDTTDAVASVNGYTGNITLNKSDVGLGNVDNTSDATRNAATATLTNKTVSLASNTLTGTVSQFNTALSDGDFATLAGTETLTNKTLTTPKIEVIADPAGNSSIAQMYSRIYLSPLGRSAVQVLSSANAVNYLVFEGRTTGNKPTIYANGSDTNVSLNLATQGTGTVQANGVDIVTLSGTQSLTNKTISLASNTVTGTVAQFNTALSDGDFATLAGVETLTNKTFTDPKVTNIKSATGGAALYLYSPSDAVNHVGLYGTATANPVYIAALGPDANIPLYLSAKGTSAINIGNSGGTGLQVSANSATANWLAVYSQATGQAPLLLATGNDTNVNLNLATKGTGTVQANGVDIVTTTATQTLTNKTLTSPAVSGVLTTSGSYALRVNALGALSAVILGGDSANGLHLGYTAVNGQHSNLTTVGDGVVNSFNGDLVLTSRFAGGSIIFGTTTTGIADVERAKIDSSGVFTVGGVPVVTTTGAQAVQNKTLDSTNTSTKFISRSVATVTAPTALGSTAATDYVTFADMRRTVALLHCEGSDGSTSVVDSSNLGAGWTCVGNAQISTAQSKWGGSSIYFDGTGDYITPTADSSNFAFAGDFTIEMWIRPTSLGALKIFYDTRDSGATALPRPVLLIDATDHIAYSFNGSTRIATTATVTIDTWHHVALSRSSGVTTLFLDGVAAGTTYTDSTPTTCPASRPIVGKDGAASVYYFTGHMDEISIVNGLARYTANFTPPTGPLDNITEDVSTAPSTVALLHCDGANASTTVTDSGVLLSNWTAGGHAQISTAQSKFGGSSLYFDGTGDYITPTADSSNFTFGSGDFTVEMCLRASDFTSARVLFDFRAANGAYPMLYLSDTGALTYYANTAARITAGSNLSINTWYHVAVCRSGTSTKLFVDGVQVGSTWTDTTVYLGAANRPTFGCNYSIAQFFTGYMDEIRISRVARYTSNFTPPTVPHPDPPAIKLPTAVANTNRYTVKCVGPQTVLLSNGNGQLIDGAATVAIPQGDSNDVVSDSAKWVVV